MSDAVVGVDVGGTKVAVATLHDGALSQPRVQPTRTGGADELIGQLVELIAVQGDGVRGVGVGVPSVVDPAGGRVRASVNLPLHDVPLGDLLAERTGLPVRVDNDANCAALAEAVDEHGRPLVGSLVMLTVGTGVGGGIVLGGRLHRGASGAAGELGHQIIAIPQEGDLPRPGEHFPLPWSLEALASGRALDRLAQRCGLPDGHAVVEAAQAGDARARAMLDHLADRLAIGIANAINVFDPDVVAIGGGVSTAGPLLLERARETALRFVLPGVGTRTEIRLARAGATAGVLGAALLALHQTIDDDTEERRCRSAS